MNKIDAINKLCSLKDRGNDLLKLRRGNQDLKKWRRDTEIAIGRIFDENPKHLSDFTKIKYSLNFSMTGMSDSEFDKAYSDGVKSAITVIESFIDEINDYWDSESIDSHQSLDAIEKVELLIRRFHEVARQLRSRYSDRSTIEIDDEYDVQYLFNALLKIYFDDVRAEECTPSYAGSSSRVDFLLKDEKIIIEIKKTRKGLSAKEVGEQLIIDMQRYQAHPNCNHLICFVYDPEARISNPRGIENDLTKITDGLPVSVFIRPE